jgi:hypothetical protein
MNGVKPSSAKYPATDLEIYGGHTRLMALYRNYRSCRFLNILRLRCRAHLFDLYPNLPERRGFQFFVSFPAPRGPLHSKEVPFDEHKALRETTLYASVPKGGVDAALLEEWKATGTGLYRKDNNEFPHGLFDPKWKLRLQTVADRFQGYFDHPEPKSNGRVGELKCTNSKRM